MHPSGARTWLNFGISFSEKSHKLTKLQLEVGVVAFSEHRSEDVARREAAQDSIAES